MAPLLLAPTVLSLVIGHVTPAGATGGFTAGDVVIYRVGGGATLSSASAQVSLDEYSPTGAFVQSVPLPTSTNGSNNALTASGTGASEGMLTESADTRYLMATGYDTGIGTANVASSSVSRTVGRVDASDNVDTSTVLSDFAVGNNPRSATSSDGTNIWVGGAAGGVRYATLCSASPPPCSTTSTSLNITDKNVRQVSDVNGQLYTSADPTKSGSLTLATVGTGLPTTANQTITNLPFAPAPNEPYQYVFLTLGSGPGPNVLYVADNGNNAVERYNLESGVWTGAGSTPISGVIGLTGRVSGGTVNLYATSTNSNGNTGTLWKIVDTSGTTGTLTATASNLLSAPSGETFRGVAFAPGTPIGSSGGGVNPTITTAYSGLPAALGDATNPTLGITVGDTAFPTGPFTVTATSADQSVAADSGITVTGSGTSWTLSVTPGSVGETTILLTVTAPDTAQAAASIAYGVSAAAADPDVARYYSSAGNASTAIDVGGGYILVADDESNVLRLYQEDTSGPPVKTFDFTSDLPFGGTEVDIEASAQSGNRIYWEGSMSNGASGENEPARSTLFATDISGSGVNTTLTYVGSYTGLSQDLIAWDEAGANNGQYPPNYFGLAASASVGVPPHETDAVSAEGLEFAPGSTTTAYLGFRAPLETPTNRTDALVVPITNINDLVDNGNQTSTHATFGPPIQWDLGLNGVREIRKNADSQYLVIAGASDETPGQTLYLWDGVPTDPPRQTLTPLELGPDRGNWETIVDVPEPLSAGSTFELIQDNGDTAWYGDGLTSKNGLNVDIQKDFGDVFTYEPPAPLATTTTLSSSQNPSLAGSAVTYSAVVTATNTPPPGARTPTGTVEFTDGGTDIGGCSASALDGTGTATCTTTYPVSGSHDIVATYSGGIVGDDTYAGSTSSDLTQGVGVVLSSTALTSSINPVGKKQSLTYTATVTGTGPPTGTINFLDGTFSIPGCASVPLNGSAVATCRVKYKRPTTTKNLPHQITATYGGDDANSNSRSNTITETVSKGPNPYTTTTSLSSSTANAVVGHPVTFTATITTGSGVPTGKVQFLEGTTVVGSCKHVSISASLTATCTITFKQPGNPSVTASFPGDKFDKPSSSAPLSITVAAAPTNTSVTSSINPVAVNGSVKFTATVSSTDGGSPTGTVAFSVGGTPIPGCSAKAVSGAGTATCTTSFSAPGEPTVEADYSGSNAFAPSTGTIDETVNP
jgi:hypothetical protein